MNQATIKLREALEALYVDTADYIRLNNLGDVHQNQSMRMARDALAASQEADTQEPVARGNEHPALVQDLAMTVRRLVRRLEKDSPGTDTAAQALDFLRRKGLQGSILRAAPPSQEADTVSSELPPLPEYGINTASHIHTRIKGYTADQMHAYGQQCAALSRAAVPPEPDISDRFKQTIIDALLNHRLIYTREGDGGTPYLLVDMLSPFGGTIAQGAEEIEDIADAIIEASCELVGQLDSEDAAETQPCHCAGVETGAKCMPGCDVPEGWMPVPKYPTQAMRDAGNCQLDQIKREPGMEHADRAFYAYCAMLHVAPVAKEYKK
jgi:hypothetical protein